MTLLHKLIENEDQSKIVYVYSFDYAISALSYTKRKRVC